MSFPNPSKVYPRSGDMQTVYLKNVVSNPNIIVGDYTIYHDALADPRGFERRNVLYHYPLNHDKLVIGRFCSIASGVRFLMNGSNHARQSLSTYPFSLLGEEWDDSLQPQRAWDNHGNTRIGNDVWIGMDVVIHSGVRIGDGAIIGARAVVTGDVPPYAVVAGVPAKVTRMRYTPEEIEYLQLLAWWDWDPARIQKYLPLIQNGDLKALMRQITPAAIAL